MHPRHIAGVQAAALTCQEVSYKGLLAWLSERALELPEASLHVQKGCCRVSLTDQAQAKELLRELLHEFPDSEVVRSHTLVPYALQHVHLVFRLPVCR